MQSSVILVTYWNNRLTDYRQYSTKLRNGVLYRFHIISAIENKDFQLFKYIVASPQHLNSILLQYEAVCLVRARDRDYPYKLLRCKYNAYKQSF